LIIPLRERAASTEPAKEKGVRYAVTEAYCPEGCSLIDHEHLIEGQPGLRIAFKRPGMEGQFVISAVEGDFDKIILSGELEDGVKDELYCPSCGAIFKKLVNCPCQPGADMVAIGLTPKLDFNNAISFCNVTGCTNGKFVKSGAVIVRTRLNGQI
jgi:hypothetical protein